MDSWHYPVLHREVLQLLVPERGLFLDGTLGEGGHSGLILDANPEVRVVGVDADSAIQEVAMERLAHHGERILFVNSWFDQVSSEYPLGGERPMGILLDLGVSTFHYRKSGRGFSFSRCEPLDMRLSDGDSLTAGEIVNGYSQQELADLFYQYGEERNSRRIAATVVAARRKAPIGTTTELGELVVAASPGRARGRIHPATKVFQALRIAVNRELARLEDSLDRALELVEVGGRVGVISFHSLEDRIVKNCFRMRSRVCQCPPEQPICNCGRVRRFKLIPPVPIVPGREEVDENPPSRSAKFRVIQKVS